MNIVVLSDLNWEPNLRTVSEKEVNSFSIDRLSTLRYQRIYRYLQIIENEKADLVLFAGDITGDGSCGHGFHFAFIILLNLLESKKIPSVFISGNHDDPNYYNIVDTYSKQLHFSQNINEQSIELLNQKIVGISYDCSKSKRKLQKFIADNSSKHDIVLAHAQLKRRIRLFDIPADYIITGHFDRKILPFRNSVFVALNNDSEEVSYAVIRKNIGDSDIVEYKIQPAEGVVLSLEENMEQLKAGQRNHILKINNDQALDLVKMENASYQQLINERGNYLYLKYLRGHAYLKSLNTLYKIKSQIEPAENDLTVDQIFQLQITDAYKISKSLIEDYLTKADLKKTAHHS